MTTLYQAVKCPEGHYKVPEALFDQQCERMGLPCPAEKGYSCYCKPCIKAFEVDLLQFDSALVTEEEAGHTQGCSKVSKALFFVPIVQIRCHLTNTFLDIDVFVRSSGTN